MSTLIACGCGWVSKPSCTAARAEYAFRKHSCEKARRGAETAARGAAARAAVDRTPKPCRPGTRVPHAHGTYVHYKLCSCRCRPCAVAVADYGRRRTRQSAYGRWQPYVDAEPTRQHCRQLMAGGMGLKRIAAVSGISSGVIWKLLYGKRRPDGNQIPSKRIRYETAIRLQTVRLDLAAGAKVDPTGTRRRLRALVTTGWSMSKLGERLNIDPGNFGTLMHHQVAVTKTRWTQVRALYDELWDQPPPESEWRDKIAASRARNYAQARGWLPPLAWDDDTIDDPNGMPNVFGHDPDRFTAITSGVLLAGDEDLELAVTDDDLRAVLYWADNIARIPVAELSRRTGVTSTRFYQLRAKTRTNAVGAGAIDEVMVQRLVAGTLRLSKHTRAPERIEAVRRLAANRFSDQEIGERIGMTGTTVCALRLRHDIPSALPSGRTA